MSGYVAAFLFVLFSISVSNCSSTKIIPESVISEATLSPTNSDTVYQDTMEATATMQKDRIDIPMVPNVTKMPSEADPNEPVEPNIPLLSWADFYASIRLGVPAELAESLERESTENEEKNLYEGFRIQIYLRVDDPVAALKVTSPALVVARMGVMSLNDAPVST